MALVGSGSAVPITSVSNQQLSERVDTNDEWIRTRTGIGARRICNADEPLTVLATRAAETALAHAGWQAEDLDLILMATSSPDDLFGTAPRVQGALGARHAVAFDLTAACSGFLFALITAGQYLRSGAMRRALVIGADQLDWLLLHQATQRILDAVADRYKIPHDQVLSNLSNYGNTSAATIPLMLDEAVRDGRVRSGHLIASSGFG
ncbi:MAG: 3-oxoacyl-[acyl-carrier-protein] synthase III C-terminal domain-containing protein, partial [Vulcanococcus sp.]